jgi:hypothetical protein
VVGRRGVDDHGGAAAELHRPGDIRGGQVGAGGRDRPRVVDAHPFAADGAAGLQLLPAGPGRLRGHIAGMLPGEDLAA